MIQVDQRSLGASGIAVPPLGVGVWSWGDKNFWGYGQEYNRGDVSQAYKASQDGGINFFDTAEMYARGESEQILGECMQEDGRPVVIASKFAPLPNRFSARSLLKALDASLKRLNVKTIDLYQIHWPYTFIGVDALMDVLAEAVRSGKVRAVGVSNYGADLMRRAHARLARHDIPLASNQVHYNLLYRKPEKNGVLDACRELNVALIAYSPLEQGLLTGKYRVVVGQANTMPRQRRFSQMFRASQRRKMEPLLQTMEEIAKDRGKTIGQVTLNWLLLKDELIIPIPGAKNLRQASENAGAIGWQLTRDEFERIDFASQPFS